MKKAKRIQLFDGNGNELTAYKAIVNEDQETEVFSVVKNGYKIVQHEEVYKTVSEAIEDKNLRADIRCNSVYNGNGGRLHIEVTFDDIALDVEQNGILAHLYLTYDNSYDGTTGLRLGVGAKRGSTILWVDGARYFHKHTKAVSVLEFEKRLDKGIKAFQTQIRKQFLDMVKTPVTQAQAEDFLENAKEIKNITKSYVEEIQVQVKSANITNKWQLYVLICEVVNRVGSSLDATERQLKALVGRLHKVFRSKDLTPLAVTNPPQGATLQDVVDNHQGQSNQEVSPEKDTLPDNVIALEAPQQLRIARRGKKYFAVMLGDTEIEYFKKYKQAKKYLKNSDMKCLSIAKVGI